MAFSVSSTVPRTISPRWSRIRASSIWITCPIGFSSLIGCSFILEEASNPESAKDSVRYRRALAAPVGGAVGKDTLSRVWRKVKADWEAWNARSLAEEPIVRLILDGTLGRGRVQSRG